MADNADELRISAEFFGNRHGRRTFTLVILNQQFNVESQHLAAFIFQRQFHAVLFIQTEVGIIAGQGCGKSQVNTFAFGNGNRAPFIVCKN